MRRIICLSKRFWILLGLLPGIISPMPAFSQDEQVTISISLPMLQSETLVYSGLIDEFEASHPNIQIYVAPTDFLPFIQSSTEAEQVATASDVVVLETNKLYPELTLAGYFLDLSPLVNADNTLNADDFYPVAWQSFQWDGGIWAIPSSFELSVLSYDVTAFDQAGLAYPNANWTAFDLANAARTLTTRDDAGDVVTEGLRLDHAAEYELLRSLLGENLFDETTYPAVPRLNTPAVAQLLDTWSQLYSEGVVGYIDLGIIHAPLEISGFYEFNGNPDRVGVLLPGGRAGMRTTGLAISAGTAFPEQAYEFIKFLSNYPDSIGSSGWGALPARQGETAATLENLTPELQALLTQAIPLAMPLGELRNFNYFSRAVYRISQGMTPEDALQAVESLAIGTQEGFLVEREIISISVTPPPTREEDPEGEIVLRFGFHAFAAAMSLNESLWNRVIDDFVAYDPQVGRIDMENLANRVDFSEHFDCFFTPYGIDLIQPNIVALNLDPLIAADPNFDADDFVPGALQQVTFEGQLYGYPLIVQFEVLDYDINAFEEAGIPLPNDGWTANDFIDALNRLKPYTGDAPVFSTTRFISTDLQQVIAAFNGLPIDYRTEPPSAHFTDAANIEAIRSVLDLAKAGYIEYIPRPEPNEIPSSTYDAPIMTNSIGLFRSMPLRNTRIGSTLYPAGEMYTPIGMGVGVFYISSTSPYPEACYRWLNTIVENPALINFGMPARRSTMDSPEYEAAQGTSNIALYNHFYERLESPNLVVIPSWTVGSGTLAGGWLEQWLYEAFTAYVIDDVDLEAALNDAQVKADAYLGCVSELPEFDSSQDYLARYEIYTECAARVDPSVLAP
jgi:ABC-type glycerol-3-phosphate transport system substrate-binding protein